MYIASEHIQQWVRTGEAKVVSDAVASQLGEYLDHLPWLPSGNGLDWGVMKGNQADLSTLTEEQQFDWLRTTPMGGDPFLVFLYVADQPCIVCDMKFAISNIDQAFWKAPGKRYVFGASLRNGVIEPVMPHFAEYDQTGILTVAQLP
jgi:hypothetical protein